MNWWIVIPTYELVEWQYQPMNWWNGNINLGIGGMVIPTNELVEW
jgi:hypothetical protein